ncbi:Golgi-associated kinase 1A-like isoform X1 [Acipenser ruthenus]|uniref:Golgi-associated kinase 1A-like isoform X1 n=2 Tax=Acipenser ruthenus TaxID=7906 RepID=UPI00145B14D7|nr:Golgi-associated kinase 1A-like isoform X1 [Acipenser ruthenus]
MATRLCLKMRCKRRPVVAFSFLFALSVMMINSFLSFPPAYYSLQELEPREDSIRKRAVFTSVHEHWTLGTREEPIKYFIVEKPKNDQRAHPNKLPMSSNTHTSKAKRKTQVYTSKAREGRYLHLSALDAEGVLSNRQLQRKEGDRKNIVSNRTPPIGGDLQSSLKLKLIFTAKSQTNGGELLQRKYKPDVQGVTGGAKKFVVPLAAGGKLHAKDIRKLERKPRPATSLDRKMLPLLGQWKDESRPLSKAARQTEFPLWGKLAEDPFPEDLKGNVRFGEQPPPWFSPEDVRKMKLLADGVVINKSRVPSHGQVMKVGLRRGTSPEPEDLEHHCQDGLCALIKRPEDWFEVFAFHLDRVLGLNRSLPSVTRKFHSELLPYKFTRGPARPIVWWDPDIQHLSDDNTDQNSFPLTWLQYQAVLKQRCGVKESSLESSVPCVGVRHSEWGKLAFFDFLLQVSDRLDRYCCGFKPDPSESCVEEMLHEKCRNPKGQVLVHILVRKEDPTRLVFIDNAGRPHHPEDNLNFRLLEGIVEVPETAVSVLKSGCLQSMLLQSLYTDKEFWENQGRLPGLKQLTHNIERRGKILLQYIQDNKLKLNRDN